MQLSCVTPLLDSTRGHTVVRFNDNVQCHKPLQLNCLPMYVVFSCAPCRIQNEPPFNSSFQLMPLGMVQSGFFVVQIDGMKSYGVTDEVKKKVQTLMPYEWARAVWEAKEPGVQKAYSSWLHERSFPLAASG